MPVPLSHGTCEFLHMLRLGCPILEYPRNASQLIIHHGQQLQL